MGVNFPSELSVECDICGETKEFSTTEFVGECGGSVGIDKETLESENWECVNGCILCPTCKKESEE